MHLKSKQTHMIDFLFPIALFFVFAVSTLSVILLATEIYQNIINDSSLSDTSRTSLAYISEKLHQSDGAGKIYLQQTEALDTLIIEQTYADTVYHTYIYAYEQELKEQFIKDGTAFVPANGITILQITAFDMEELDTGLFSFSCTDEDGHTANTIVHIRSN